VDRPKAAPSRASGPPCSCLVLDTETPPESRPAACLLFGCWAVRCALTGTVPKLELHTGPRDGLFLPG